MSFEYPGSTGAEFLDWESEESDAAGYTSGGTQFSFGSPGSETSESSDSCYSADASESGYGEYDEWTGGPAGLGVRLDPLPFGDEKWNGVNDQRYLDQSVEIGALEPLGERATYSTDVEDSNVEPRSVQAQIMPANLPLDVTQFGGTPLAPSGFDFGGGQASHQTNKVSLRRPGPSLDAGYDGSGFGDMTGDMTYWHQTGGMGAMPVMPTNQHMSTMPIVPMVGMGQPMGMGQPVVMEGMMGQPMMVGGVMGHNGVMLGQQFVPNWSVNDAFACRPAYPQVKTEPAGLQHYGAQHLGVGLQPPRRAPRPQGRIPPEPNFAPPIGLNCPFCHGCENSDGKTRQRRALARERKTPKVGRWWRQFGYDGPKYCQRCSEVFRDHIMRQKRNSAKCSRESPCDDCFKVLQQFDVSSHELWARFDERAQSNKLKRSKGVADAKDAKDVTPPNFVGGDCEIGPGVPKAKKTKTHYSALAGALAMVSVACVAVIQLHGFSFGGTEASADGEVSLPPADVDTCYQWRRVPDSDPPPARMGAVSWTGEDGNLVLFGGIGWSFQGNTDASVDAGGHRNDMWRMKADGNQTQSDAAYVFEQVVPDSDSWPLHRSHAMSFKDPDGNAFIFGGMSVDTVGMDDLWRFDGNTWKKFHSLSQAAMPALTPAADAAAAGWPMARGRSSIVMSSDRSIGFMFGGSLGFTDGTNRPLADLWFIGSTTSQTDGHLVDGRSFGHFDDFCNVNAKSGIDECDVGYALGAQPFDGECAGPYIGKCSSGWGDDSVGSDGGFVYVGPPNADYVAVSEQNISIPVANQNNTFVLEWPAARASHAAWIDADNNFIIFGGVGIEGTSCGALTDAWMWNGGQPKFPSVLPQRVDLTWNPAKSGTWFRLSEARATMPTFFGAPGQRDLAPSILTSSTTKLNGTYFGNGMIELSVDQPKPTSQECMAVWGADKPFYRTLDIHTDLSELGVDDHPNLLSTSTVAGTNELWVLQPSEVSSDVRSLTLGTNAPLDSQESTPEPTNWNYEARDVCSIIPYYATGPMTGFASWPVGGDDAFVTFGGMVAKSTDMADGDVVRTVKMYQPTNDIWVWGPTLAQGTNVSLDGEPSDGLDVNVTEVRASSMVTFTDPALIKACGERALVVTLVRDRIVGFGMAIHNDNGEVFGWGLGADSAQMGPAEAAGILVGDGFCALGSPLRPVEPTSDGSFAQGIRDLADQGSLLHLALRPTPSHPHEFDNHIITRPGCNSTTEGAPCNSFGPNDPYVDHTTSATH